MTRLVSGFDLWLCDRHIKIDDPVSILSIFSAAPNLFGRGIFRIHYTPRLVNSQALHASIISDVQFRFQTIGNAFQRR